MIRAETKQGEFIFWCDDCEAEIKRWNMEKPFPHKASCGHGRPDDVKVIPAEMMREYNAELTGEEIAKKWNTSEYYVKRLLTERGVEWKHPESRQI